MKRHQQVSVVLDQVPWKFSKKGNGRIAVILIGGSVAIAIAGQAGKPTDSR
jgi:hypothetical protein